MALFISFALVGFIMLLCYLEIVFGGPENWQLKQNFKWMAVVMLRALRFSVQRLIVVYVTMRFVLGLAMALLTASSLLIILEEYAFIPLGLGITAFGYVFGYTLTSVAKAFTIKAIRSIKEWEVEFFGEEKKKRSDEEGGYSWQLTDDAELMEPCEMENRRR